MSIVVTGASGFIGGSLLAALASAGHDVVTLDRRPLPRGRLTGTHLRTELTQPSDAALDALHEAQAVLHLAGCPGVRDRAPDVAHRRQRDNVDATRAVLAASGRQTPVLVLSSSSVYGGATPMPQGDHVSGPVSAPRIRGSRESDPVRARGGYAASKIAAEQVCRQHAATGAPVLVVRPFTVLGEGQRPDMAVARWAHEARSTGAITVLGSPSRTRDFTDVRAVARTLMALMTSGATGTVNIGTGHARSLAELAEAVSLAVGVAPDLQVVSAGRAEVAHTLADTDRLRSLTGVVPRTDLVDVVARSVASLEARRGSGAEDDPDRGAFREHDTAVGPELVGV